MAAIYERPSILVVAMKYDGYGDVMGAHEIALRIQNAFDAKVVFSIMEPQLGERKDLMKGFHIVPTDEFHKEWKFPDEQTVLKCIKTFKLIVVFPCYDDPFLPPKILKNHEKVIKIQEYDAQEHPLMGLAYKLGFGEDRNGVIFPDDLYDYYQKHKEDSAAVRLQNLKDVPTSLCQAILGEEYSDEALQKYAENGELYYGYTRENMYAKYFIQSLCSFSKHENITIIRLGNAIVDISTSLSKALYKNGFIGWKFMNNKRMGNALKLNL